jgi:hypothetical protein
MLKNLYSRELATGLWGSLEAQLAAPLYGIALQVRFDLHKDEPYHCLGKIDLIQKTKQHKNDHSGESLRP